MLEHATFFLGVRELSRRLRAREVTSLELTEGYLERLRTIGTRLNAVVTLTEERAIAEARAADRDLQRGHWRGPLHGIPYGVKDLLAARGYPTSWGAEPYRNQMFDTDAAVVRRLQAAGAVLMAKLAMVELAGGFGYEEADASFTGPGLTPWNLEYWSGGSSSGSGAATAAGLVGFAIGSETAGSILTPAAFCGVSGLRPTFGRVSRAGAMTLCWTLDKIGPLCRTADDCGLVLAAIAGADPEDPSTVRRPFAWPGPRPPKRRLRIAVPRGAFEKAQAAVRDNFETSLHVLEAFASVTRDVPWPDLPWGATLALIVNTEETAAFLPLIESGDMAKLRSPTDRISGYAGLTTFAVDYVQALRIRAVMQRAMSDYYHDYDVVAAPGRASVAFPVTGKFTDAYPEVQPGPALIPAGNLCGLPCVCIPSGFADNNLPTSISLMGAPFTEGRLLDLAAAFQSRTDWHRRVPPAA